MNQPNLEQCIPKDLLSKIPKSLKEEFISAISQSIHHGFLKGKTLISENPAIVETENLFFHAEIEGVIQAKLYQWIQEYNNHHRVNHDIELFFDQLTKSVIQTIASGACQIITTNINDMP